MSHAYDTRTFTVPSQEVPASFSSLDDFEAFEKGPANVAYDRTDGLHFVWGSTRSGWAIEVVHNLLQPAPDFDALRFLSFEGHMHKFESEYGYTALSVLDPKAVDDAIAQIDRLLADLAADPLRVYRADYAGVFSDPDVETSMKRDYVSAKPAYDDQVWGDEGQSADYLFTYLRSIRALLGAAQAEGLSVVHTLKV